MAPQTRSRASDGAARVNYYEPPPPPITTSASKSKTTRKSKVYRRSDPTPQQVHFPARKKTIRTYGKGRRSLPAKTPDQSTLTQIGWIPSTYQEDEEDDLGELLEPTTLDNEKDDWTAEERKRSCKRRKTTGDIVPDSTAGSSYHTQTLTQMPSFMSEQQSEEGEEEVEHDDKSQGDLEFNADEENIPPKSVGTGGVRGASPPKRKNMATSSVQRGEVLSSLPPQSPTGPVVAETPRKQIVERAVIPSSQPSPFTPNLGIADRYWTKLDQTPLKGKSTNLDAPTPTAIGTKRPPTLEIADSWSTVNGGMSSSPLKRSQRPHRTPLKEITLGELANMSVDLGESPARETNSPAHQSVAEDGATTGPEGAVLASQKPARPGEEIIIDSEDDFDFYLEDENAGDEAPATPTPAHRVSSPNHAAVPANKADRSAPSVPTEATQSLHHATRRNPTPELPENDEAQPETPSPSPQRRPSVSSLVEGERETPLTSPQKTSPALPPATQLNSRNKIRILSPEKPSQAMPPVSQLGYRYKSQAFESQRVPFEKIRQLGPQTDRSDVILSIHPEQADQIAEGIKTHEFRNYRIPQTVGRIWIYVTRPVCELMYMAPISAAKQPGDISADDLGVGNKEFNEGAGLKFAYELKQVYELNNPVPLARMKDNGWVEEAPAKYVYVPPAVLGELFGNLRCALFAEPGEMQSSQVDMSVSQEVAMQLQSDNAQSTQLSLVGSSQPRRRLGDENQDDADVASSSQVEDAEHGNKTIRATGGAVADDGVFVKPTMPPSRSQKAVRLAEDSPVARRSQPSQYVPDSSVRPSQATTASGPSSPSQSRRSRRRRSPQTRGHASIPLSPPTKSVRRAQLIASSSMSSSHPEDMIVGDSPVRGRGGVETQASLLLGSSQGFASAEQDSLLDDSRVRQPPDVIWDSEGEFE